MSETIYRKETDYQRGRFSRTSNLVSPTVIALKAMRSGVRVDQIVKLIEAKIHQPPKEVLADDPQLRYYDGHDFWIYPVHWIYLSPWFRNYLISQPNVDYKGIQYLKGEVSFSDISQDKGFLIAKTVYWLLIALMHLRLNNNLPVKEDPLSLSELKWLINTDFLQFCPDGDEDRLASLIGFSNKQISAEDAEFLARSVLATTDFALETDLSELIALIKSNLYDDFDEQAFVPFIQSIREAAKNALPADPNELEGLYDSVK